MSSVSPSPLQALESRVYQIGKSLSLPEEYIAELKGTVYLAAFFVLLISVSLIVWAVESKSYASRVIAGVMTPILLCLLVTFAIQKKAEIAVIRNDKTGRIIPDLMRRRTTSATLWRLRHPSMVRRLKKTMPELSETSIEE